MPSEFGGAINGNATAQYDVLRRRIERVRGITINDTVSLPSIPETDLHAPLGLEAKLFLTLLHQINASGVWAEALEGVGTAKEGDPCPYTYDLRDLSEFDGGISGLSFMSFRIDSRESSLFALTPEALTNARGAVRVLTHNKRSNRIKYADMASTHASMLSLALRLFAFPVEPGGTGLGLEMADSDIFKEEMHKALGPSADLGGGALHFDNGNVACVYEPMGWLNAHLRVRDVNASVPLSDRLLQAAYFSKDELESTLEKARETQT